MLRLWRALLTAGVAALFAHDVGHVGWRGGDAFFDQWLYEGLELLAAAGCLVRPLVVRRERLAWTALGLALLATAIGDLLWEAVYGGNAPFPSFADLFYLSFYPAAYLGIVSLVRQRVSSFGASLWLDGVTSALAAGALGASVLVEVVVRSTHGSPRVVLTNLAYPLGDIVLLALVVFVFAASGWRPGRGWTLIGAGLLASSVGDAVYLYQAAVGSYTLGSFVDVLWPASLALIAVAAWQNAPARRQGGLEHRTLYATPLVCGLVATGVLVAATVVPVHPLAAGLAAAALVLVLGRTALTFRENSALLDRIRTESLSDPLTGLGNRRRLVGDLERYLAGREPSGSRLLVLFDLNGFKRYNDTFGHLAGDALLARFAQKLEAAVGPTGAAYRMGGDEFCVFAPVSAGLLDQTVAALSERGESFTVSAAFGAVTLPEEASDTTAALSLADQRLYADKENLIFHGGSSHELLLRTLAEREPDLREHSTDVARLAVAAARRLGLDGPELDALYTAAELHDIGKLAIPDAVLQKPGPLDPAELAFIRRHTVIGQRILGGSPALRRVGEIVRATHEHWDGNGYPDQLAGDQIPLPARIISACDAFLAITSDRPYRAARTGTEAVAELRRCAGTQFDPRVVTTLCDLLEHGHDLDEAPLRLAEAATA